jgi:hypothetical protein
MAAPKKVRLATAVAAAGVIAAWIVTASAQQKLPYSTINHPRFIPAAQVTFLSQNDFVLGITDGKVAKAYPMAILAQHGVVQDHTSKGPIAVTW